jgi:hypothetical protein
MKIDSSAWLITFSDLFFILVSFFILRHQLVELPKPDTLLKSIQEIAPPLSSLYTQQQTSSFENKVFTIDSNWFSSPSELSSKGEEMIKFISHQIRFSNARLEMEIRVTPEDLNSEDQELRTQKLLTSLEANEISKLNLHLIAKREFTHVSHGELRLIFGTQH